MRPTTSATPCPSRVTDMLARILTAGLAGGVLGGAAIAVVQSATTIPLILHAESFEAASAMRDGLVHLVHAHAPAQTAAPAHDLGRFALTLVATIALATGYAWMLLAAMFARGEIITARSAVLWAVAAFFAAGLAPALGLAPELPGAAAADLTARQLWWVATAVASAAGLAAILIGRTPLWIAVGLAALVIPHLVGAPHAHEVASRVPAEIAARFAAASLVVQALMWILPGTIAGYIMSRRPARV
jgi:cobalt transporter subunit CbtA